MREVRIAMIARPKVHLWSLLLCAGVIAMSCTRYKGEDIFKEHLRDPIPPSVRNLDGHDSGGKSVNLFLHFKIAAPDLEKIIRTSSYVSEDPLPRLMFEHFRPPKWWNPESLGDDRMQLRLEDPNSLWRRYLIHNSAMTEVYFLVFYYY